MKKLVTTLALVAALAACGGTPTVEEKTLEQEVSDKLTEQVGQAPDRIDCPGGLEGEEGATQRCTLYAGEDKLGVDVTVTSVEDSQVNFDIAVDEEMME